MKVLKITKYEKMAKGTRFCAWVFHHGKSLTAFGFTKEEAVLNAELKLNKVTK